MIRIGKRRDPYQFSDKVHPKEGIASVVIGSLLLIGFLVLFLITSRQQGGLLIGAFGFLIFFGAILGLWYAVKAMKKEDIRYQYPIAGLILNGIVLIISISLYFVGLAANIKIS